MKVTCTSPMGSRVTFPPDPTVPELLILPVVMACRAFTVITPPVVLEVFKSPTVMVPLVLIRLRAWPGAVKLLAVMLFVAVKLMEPELLTFPVTMVLAAVTVIGPELIRSLAAILFPALRTIVLLVAPWVVRVSRIMMEPLLLLTTIGWPARGMDPRLIFPLAMRLSGPWG